MEYRTQQQSRGEGKDSYIFPTLKPQEILQCMNNLQIPFSEEELTKPNARGMQVIYEAFTDIFMGVTKEQFQPEMAVINDLEYPLFYEDSISYMAYYRHLTKFMAEIGVDNFSFRDFTKPESNHVRRVLSAIINFAKFREDRMVVFDQYTQKSDELLDRRQELEQQNAECHERVNAIKSQRQQQEPAIKKLKEINEGHKKELNELHSQQQKQVAEVQELKNLKAELQGRLSNNSHLKANAKQDCLRLKSRIVHSPEKLKQVIAELSSSLINEKSSVTVAERKMRELEMKLDMMGIVEQEIQTCINLMKDCDGEIEKFELASKKAQQTRESIERKRLEQKDLTIKDQQLKRQLASVEEKIQRLQHQCQMKRESMTKKLSQLQEEYTQIQGERDNVQAKLDEHKQIMGSTEQKTSDIHTDLEQKMLSLEQEYNKLKTQAEYYQNEMLQSLGIASNEVIGRTFMEISVS